MKLGGWQTSIKAMDSIGGVVATDIENGGVISPGGVGFDINCGVRLCSIDLGLEDLVHLTRKKSGSGTKEFGNG